MKLKRKIAMPGALEYFLVARGASVDRFSGDLSIFGVVTEITPRRLPAIILRLIVVTGWIADAAEVGQEVRGRILLRIPGSPVEHEPREVEFVLDSRLAVHLHYFVGIPVVQVGDIEIELEINGQIKAHHRIIVNEPDAAKPPDGWMMYTLPADAPNAPDTPVVRAAE